MTFELGKTYIVDVTEKGIIPQEVFDRDRWYNKDYDDLDFLTNEEKIVVINDALDKIRVEIEALTNGAKPERIWNVDVLAIIDKYKAETKIEQGLNFSDQDTMMSAT